MSRAELVLAGLVLAGALAADLLWVQPAAERLDRLSGRHAELATLAADLGFAQAGVSASDEQIPGPDATEGAALAASDVASDRGPVRVLEAPRSRRRLVQRELRLLERRDQGPVRETSYYMEVHGAFAEVFGFLRDLERSGGQVVVDRFRMVTASGDPGVTLYLWTSVLTASV